ncbi:MAG: cysteine desulfurase family protein [Eubacteriales bacterium]|nr:cysteine desulfurase family protein [Eubacteriales bacterium]
MEKQFIYLDHAATTALRPQALEAMLPFLRESYGNASAIYSLGSQAKIALEDARAVLAKSIGAEPSEIFFTSGGTESDNWALIAAAEAQREKGRHIVTSAVEHHAVLRTCEYLRGRGFEITLLPVDREGRVDPARAEAALRPDTILLSVMAANNEVGTVQPVAELAEAARRHGVLFHTDAVQAYGKTDLSVREIPVDLLSASAHKIGGPKGIGFLYVRRGLRLGAYQRGGMQERGRRAGTENVAGAVGFAAAVTEAFALRVAEEEREAALQRYFVQRMRERIPDAVLNGVPVDPVDAEPDGEMAADGAVFAGREHGDGAPGTALREEPVRRLRQNLNFSIPGVDAEAALIMLDMRGICASGGSACTTGAIEPSHVLTAMGLTASEARGALRFTLGEENTREQIEETVCALAQIAEQLRRTGGH